MEKSNKKLVFSPQRKIAVRWALLVWLSGFGVMNVLWLRYLLAGPVDASLPGLYDYYAATIGDGICLPCMVWFGLTALGGKKLEGRRYWLCIGAVGIAVLVAVCVQLSWIADPNIGLNWTIPRVHYFNLAGWYHALFFAGMVGTSVMLFAAIWFLRKEILSESSNAWFYAFWSTVMLFGYMHAMDDYAEKFGYPMTFFVIFLTGLLVQMVYQWGQPQIARKMCFALGGSIFSLTIAVLIAIVL